MNLSFTCAILLFLFSHAEGFGEQVRLISARDCEVSVEILLTILGEKPLRRSESG